MKFTLGWLKEHLDTDASLDDISQRLTMVGLEVEKITNRKADVQNEKEVGAPLQGRLSKVLVKSGDKVKANQALFVIEAMKMETTVTSLTAGKVKQTFLEAGALVEQDDLVIVLE